MRDVLECEDGMFMCLSEAIHSSIDDGYTTESVTHGQCNANSTV